MIRPLLALSLEHVWTLLKQVAVGSGFPELLSHVYGVSRRQAEDLQQQLINGSTLNLRVEVLGNQAMNGALGAYSAIGSNQAPTIYLNVGLLAKGVNPARLKRVFLEGIGHYLDQQLNGVPDTAGDKGALFASLLLGESPDAQRRATLLGEDDSSVVSLKGRQIVVETVAGNPSVTSVTSVIDNVPLFPGNVLSGGSTNDTDLVFGVTAEANITVTVDTTAPPAPSITSVTDNVSPVIGNVASGGRTNDTVLLIGGTAEVNSTVTVYNGATSLGTSTADGTGAWNFTTAPLLNGTTYSFNSKSTDAAGNVSAASPNHIVTVDTTAPTTPSITSATDDVPLFQGNVASGGRTNDTVLVIGGTAEANSTVTVYNGATSLGTSTAAGTGAWSFTTATLLDGTTYAFNARSTDAAGNVSAVSANYIVTVDTIVPNPIAVITAVTDNFGSTTGTVASGGSTDDTALELTGTLSATLVKGETVRMYDGTIYLGRATVSGTTWSYKDIRTLIDKQVVSYTARVTDAAGNRSGGDIPPYTVIINTTAPPAPSITSVTDNVSPVTGNVASGGRTNDTILVIGGTAEANSTVTIYNGATALGTSIAAGTGAWSFTTAPLLNGTTYSFNAKSTDAAGNVSLLSANYIVTVDTSAPPAPTITSVTDNVAPVTGNVASGGRTNDTVLVIGGTAEANSSVTVYNGGTSLGTSTADGTGAWSFTTATLLNGTTYAFNATSTDAAGNVSLASANYVVTVETTAPPAPSITSVTDNVPLFQGNVASGGRTNDTVLVIGGTAQANSSVTVYNGATALGTSSADGTGAWSFTTAILVDGTTYSFNATSTDAAGYVSTASPNYIVTVDTTVPVPIATITSVTDNFGPSTGTVASGGSTDDTALELTGILTAALVSGETVRMYDGTIYLGRATVTGTTWSYKDARTLIDKQVVSYTARVTDAAGNRSGGDIPPYIVTINATSESDNIFQLSSNNLNILSEGNGVATLRAIRIGSSQFPATLQFTSSPDSATAGGVDFTEPSAQELPFNTGLINFSAGQTEQTFDIVVTNDGIEEANEQFGVGIQNPSTGSLGAPRTARVLIVDDDGFSRISLLETSVSVSEGDGVATLTLLRSGDRSAAASVQVIISNGTATAVSDFTPLSTSTVNFPIGSFYQTVNIPIINDLNPESSESLQVQISNPQGAELRGNILATVTILDNDSNLSGAVSRKTVVGASKPTTFSWLPDGRMLVAEKSGIVKVVNIDPSTGIGAVSKTLLDLTSIVNNVGDRGLLGMEVHPQFNAGSPYVYVLYCYDPPETSQQTAESTDLSGPDEKGNRPSRLEKLTLNTSTLEVTAREVILGKNSLWQYTSRPDLDSTGDVSILPSGIVNGTTILDPGIANRDQGYQDNIPDSILAGTQDLNIRDYLATDSTSHAVGDLGFGPDGYLYVTIGDGTSYNFMDPRAVRVQDIGNLSGKMLRIDPITGAGLSSNPFYNYSEATRDLNSNQSKVFYSGLRNAFRFTFDPISRLPFIADVGYFRYEELNSAPAGANFGWPYYEGPAQTPRYEDLDQAKAFYANSNINPSSPSIQPATFPIKSFDHVDTSDNFAAIMVGCFIDDNTFVYGDISSSRLFTASLDPVTRTFDANSIKPFDAGTGLTNIVDVKLGPDGYLYGASLYGPSGGSIVRWEPVSV